MTQDWWATVSKRLNLYISELVLNEISSGDYDAATKRMEIVKSLPMLELRPEARKLARAMMTKGLIRAKAVEDALHIALASVHGMDFLVTWNCRHIADAALRTRIGIIIAAAGYRAPVICTPEELMGDVT